MKTLTAAALAEVAKQFATEPLIIVEIQWAAGTSSSFYADKKIVVGGTTIPGKILDIGNIESSLNINNYSAQEVSLTLDDTDGSIKAILERIDVHKRPAIIYQFYGDLPSLDDKFVLFRGQISTPFSWGEKDRQITFSIVNEIENYEVGFSPEEGQLDFVSEDFIGKPWPLCFGNVVHVPAQKVREVEFAVLLELLIQHDILLDYKLKRIEKAYQFAKFQFDLWTLVLQGVAAIAPEAEWILNEYIRVILLERSVMSSLVAQQEVLTFWKNEAAREPGNPVPRNAIPIEAANLDTWAITANAIALYKEQLEELTRLVEFEVRMKKETVQRIIAAYDEMRRLFGLYKDTELELCNQKRFERTTVRVLDADKFPNNTDVDVVIKGVRARVRFDHAAQTMTIIKFPIDRYTNIPILPWVKDDEPCSDIDVMNGLDLIWLDGDNPPNLEGMYLLLKKRGTDDNDGCKDRHIVKVVRQDGNKVYFDLVEWDRGGKSSSGASRGNNLDNIINGIVNSDFVLGPFGQTIPAGFFTGTLDPAIWGRPESQALLAILLRIPGGVNADELRIIAKLVFLAPRDDRMAALILVSPGPRQIFTIVGEDVAEIVAASGMIRKEWLDDYCIPYEELPESLLFRAEPGTHITPVGPDCEIYIANLLPSTIKAVNAYRTNEDGERFLCPVPSRYYIKNQAANLGSYTVTALTFPRALKNIPGEGWEDDVYVTLNSSVGRSVVDVIEWLIETYTDKTVNVANFAAVKAQLQSGGQELYPVDFAIFDRPNVLDELQRICYEARLGLILRNNEFFLKYLSSEPASDETIQEVHIENEAAITVNYTNTEELVTRLEATFKRHYLPLEDGERDPRVVLRHNIKKYGLHPRQEFWHIYSNYDLVLKSATFWMIRQSNTWKKVKLKTFHNKIRLDLLDTVLLDFNQAFFASADTKAIVEAAIYDPNENTIEFIVHTGIKVGEMLQYVHFWPALESVTNQFPTSAEIELGFAGGYGPGENVTGTIDDCPPEPEQG